MLTHAHDDHAGFLNELLDHSDAKVILHHQAVVRLRLGQNSFNGGCTSYIALAFCRVMKLLGKGDHRFPPVDRPDRYIILDNSTQPIIQEQLAGTIIHLPGHTMDSIGFLKDGKLFCGDAAMNGFPSVNRLTIWIEKLSDYRRSWEKMYSHNPLIICPSHGKPFRKEDLKKNMQKVDKVHLFPLK